VHNAFDAMPETGTLRIESSRRRAGDGAAADSVSIVVTDNGAGMAADTRARAFEPFFTTRPRKRAGLGLTIVRSIIDESLGTIEIHSAATGTRVEVLFPVVAAVSSAPDASPGNERILLVEDDDDVREVARVTLEEAGYVVVAVRNGNDALAEMAAGTSVDLVVSDLVMPGLGGRELVVQLHSTHPLMPVLYVSGHAADGPPVLDGERVGFLAKPFTAAQLLASVRSVLPITLLGSQ
jgi:two-component system, cell cycle sensor histidine kinase and response regulator CckA